MGFIIIRTHKTQWNRGNNSPEGLLGKASLCLDILFKHILSLLFFLPQRLIQHYTTNLLLGIGKAKRNKNHIIYLQGALSLVGWGASKKIIIIACSNAYDDGKDTHSRDT